MFHLMSRFHIQKMERYMSTSIYCHLHNRNMVLTNVHLHISQIKFHQPAELCYLNTDDMLKRKKKLNKINKSSDMLYLIFYFIHQK